MCSLAASLEHGRGCVDDAAGAVAGTARLLIMRLGMRTPCTCAAWDSAWIMARAVMPTSLLWYRKAAEAGSAEGMLSLATCLECGAGCDVDYL